MLAINYQLNPVLLRAPSFCAKLSFLFFSKTLQENGKLQVLVSSTFPKQRLKKLNGWQSQERMELHVKFCIEPVLGKCVEMTVTVLLRQCCNLSLTLLNFCHRLGKVPSSWPQTVNKHRLSHSIAHLFSYPVIFFKS